MGDGLDQMIQRYLDLVPLDNAISRPEAEKRASHFLVAQAHLTNHLLDYRTLQVGAVTKVNAVYASELNRAGGKTVTENKVTAEASAAYAEAREELETINNNIEYFKGYLKIFSDAHILHRNVGKEPMNG